MIRIRYTSNKSYKILKLFVQMRNRRSIKVFVARLERPKTNLIMILVFPQYQYLIHREKKRDKRKTFHIHMNYRTQCWNNNGGRHGEKPENRETLADDIGDNGCEEEVGGKEVNKTEN